MKKIISNPEFDPFDSNNQQVISVKADEFTSIYACVPSSQYLSRASTDLSTDLQDQLTNEPIL